MNSVDVTGLSPEQLIELIVAAKRALYPTPRLSMANSTARDAKNRASRRWLRTA